MGESTLIPRPGMEHLRGTRIAGIVKPKQSLDQLVANVTDPRKVRAFVEDLTDQIVATIEVDGDPNIYRLQPQEHVAFDQLLQDVDDWLDRDDPSTVIVVEEVFRAVGEDLGDLLDPEWLEKNREALERFKADGIV